MQKEIKVTPLYMDYVISQQYKVIIQIGGRFSSKSYNSEIEMAMNLGSKKNYKLLVIEDLESGLTKGYYAGLKHKIELFEHDKAYSMIKSPVEITNAINGNKALFSGYATDNQKKAVKAIDQVTEIVVEEGEWLAYSDFVALMHQLRGGSPEDRRLTILMNPVNPNCFVNEMFIESEPDKVIAYFPGTNRPKVFEKNIETSFEYDGKLVTDITKVLIVLSTHHDNPYLTLDQRASIEKLRETDPEAYLQLGEARFIRSSDTYFKEFKREIHVCEPFVIPPHWTRYRALDYGLDMLACLWFAVGPQNNVYAYKELHESDLIISKAAKRIVEINGDDKITFTYAPGDLWSRDKGTGTPIEETFRANGVSFYKASNARIHGWLAVKEALAVADSKNIHTGENIKVSKLTIFSNCTNLIKNLPQIKRDEKEPNDCATKPHEITHICDALRYFCVTRYNGYRNFDNDRNFKNTSDEFFNVQQRNNSNSFVDSDISSWG